jgi:metacaspase-1
MKKALCMGINIYPDSENNLNGCVNDAITWTNLLKSLGFEVTLLTDSNVTSTNLINWMDKEIFNANSGDSIVVTNSSHGTNVVDESGDEEDGYDEALFLYDGVLIDDKIKESLQKIKDGVKFTFISDSCFSGTLTRNKAKLKGVKPNLKPRFVVTDVRALELPKKKAFLSDMKDILIAGCSDKEYSYDAFIDDDNHGVFSYYANKTFKPGITYQEWYNLIREYLPSRFFPQTPQLEGQNLTQRALDFEIDSSIGIINKKEPSNKIIIQVASIVAVIIIIVAVILSIVL